MLFNTKLKAYAALPVLLLSSHLIHADDFQINNGTFFMNDGITPSPVSIAAGTPGLLVEGTYQGSIAQDLLLADFQFFGQPVSTYTAQTGVDALTHAAPSIDLINLTADMSSFYAFWNGTEFNQGSSTATVFDNFDGTYKLTWDSTIIGGPFNGKIGTWVINMECLTCPATTPGTTATLSVTQNGITTDGRVLTSGGVFSVTTDIADTTGMVLDWSPTDDAIDGGVAISTSTLNIDPSGIIPGQYVVSIGVRNDNTSPIEKSLASKIITVVNTGTVATFSDTDNDGISDDVDGINNLTTPTQLQLQDNNATSFLIESSAGVLVMGNTAICSYSDSASISLNNIKNNAGPACAAVANSLDITNVVQTGFGGYFNFTVRALNRGDSVDVVIPVSTPLPKNPGLRKYTGPGEGWQAFDSIGNNKIVSAAGSAGNCPVPDSSDWGTTMTEGHNCIRITITDGVITEGKTNDSDALANGSVSLTGTIIGYEGINDELVDGCSMGIKPVAAKNHLEWLLVGAFILMLGFFRKQQRD